MNRLFCLFILCINQFIFAAQSPCKPKDLNRQRLSHITALGQKLVRTLYDDPNTKFGMKKVEPHLGELTAFVLVALQNPHAKEIIGELAYEFDIVPNAQELAEKLRIQTKKVELLENQLKRRSILRHLAPASPKTNASSRWHSPDFSSPGVSDDYIETDESARVEMHATDITVEVAQKVGSLSPDTQLGGLLHTGQKGSSVLAI